VPSLGPPPVEVPKLIGATRDAAVQRLVEAHLRLGNVRRAFHDTVPAGHVIRQSAEPSSRIPQGTRVDIVVSKGHAPVDVPSVVGLAGERAVRALEHAGFIVEETTGFSNKVDHGLVLAVTPDEGTTQPYGTTVTITVSVGPETFPAPEFYGLSPDAAEALAERWGLELAMLTVPGSDGSTVTSQLPVPGTTVRYGETITVYLD
jgi:eukaryotic-like serine/threonine-protein kinase